MGKGKNTKLKQVPLNPTTIVTVSSLIELGLPVEIIDGDGNTSGKITEILFTRQGCKLFIHDPTVQGDTRLVEEPVSHDMEFLMEAPVADALKALNDTPYIKDKLFDMAAYYVAKRVQV